MKGLRSIGLLVLVACASCATDGGPVGTGISSTAAISGNVVGVQSDAVTAGSDISAALPPIQVSIDGLSEASTTADTSGNFVLSGSFAGPLTVRFTVPQFQVTQQLDVPADSVIVLQDIELRPDGVVAQAARQLNFFGTVDLVDCADGTLLVHERRSHGTQYLVRVDDQTSFVDAGGSAQSCAAIQVASVVGVDGAIAYATDRTITALVVTLKPAPPSQAQQQLEVPFSGAVVALDCTAGVVVVDDSIQQTTAQLTAQTRLSGASGALGCGDLSLGDRVRGAGRITLRTPGVITATEITVTGRLGAGQSLRLVGFVTTIDCADGLLQLRNDGTTLDVQLLQTTVITGRRGQVLTCADINPGNRVTGVGRIPPGALGALGAVQIVVTADELGQRVDRTQGRRANSTAPTNA